MKKRPLSSATSSAAAATEKRARLQTSPQSLKNAFRGARRNTVADVLTTYPWLRSFRCSLDETPEELHNMTLGDLIECTSYIVIDSPNDVPPPEAMELLPNQVRVVTNGDYPTGNKVWKLHIKGSTAAELKIAASSLPSDLKEITVSDCKNLTRLDLGGAPVDDLVVQSCQNFCHLAGYDKAQGVDIKDCDKFTYLAVQSAVVEEVCVSECRNLQNLVVGGAKLLMVTLSDCPELKTVTARAHALEELDVQGCPALAQLDVDHNMKKGAREVRIEGNPSAIIKYSILT